MSRAGSGPRRAAAIVLATGLTLGVSLAPAQAADDVEFTITDPRITESSGLAVDYTRDLYWTVNDSGDTGRVFGLQPDGSVAGVFEFGAEPVDVEAVTYTGTRLYVGDIGDNNAAREHITVYYFDNPEFTGAHGGSYRSWDFAYPDGAHDAEAMVVDTEGQLKIITKGQNAGIYEAPARPSSQGVNELTRVADAPDWVTDATALDGNRIAVRTYTTVEILDGNYQSIGRAALPFQPQGESITVPLDGKDLLVGTEGSPSDVLRVPVPVAGENAGVPPASSAPPTQQPSGQASAQGAQPGGEQPATAPGNRSGTLVALILALIAAVLGGLVAYFWEPLMRRRRQRVQAEVEEETEVLGRLPESRADSTGAPTFSPFGTEAGSGWGTSARHPASGMVGAGNPIGTGRPADSSGEPTNPQPVRPHPAPRPPMAGITPVDPPAGEDLPFRVFATDDRWYPGPQHGRPDDDPTNIR